MTVRNEIRERWEAAQQETRPMPAEVKERLAQNREQKKKRRSPAKFHKRTRRSQCDWFDGGAFD